MPVVQPQAAFSLRRARGQSNSSFGFQVFDATNTTRERRATISNFGEQNGYKVRPPRSPPRLICGTSGPCDPRFFSLWRQARPPASSAPEHYLQQQELFFSSHLTFFFFCPWSWGRGRMGSRERDRSNCAFNPRGWAQGLAAGQHGHGTEPDPSLKRALLASHLLTLVHLFPMTDLLC